MCLRVLSPPTSLSRQGKVLKQVAHFYNTIDDQIIDSQYLMLEKHVRPLESVIKNPTGGSARSQGGGKASCGPRWCQLCAPPIHRALCCSRDVT